MHDCHCSGVCRIHHQWQHCNCLMIQPLNGKADHVWSHWLQAFGRRRKLDGAHMPALTAGVDWDTEIQQWQRKMLEVQAHARKLH